MGKTRRWTTVVVSALVLAVGVVVASPTTAGAEVSEPVTTETTWSTYCQGAAVPLINGPPPSGPDLSVQATFPATAAPGDTFTVRLAPQDQTFPNTVETPIGTVPIHGLEQVHLMFELPTSSALVGAEVMEGSGAGIVGESTVEVDRSFDPARLVLNVPEIPAEPDDPSGQTTYRLPAVEMTLTGVGESGSVVSTRVAGTDKPDSGYTFVSEGVAKGHVWCWPSTEGPAPILFETVLEGPTFPSPETLTTETSWGNDCIGWANGIGQEMEQDLAFEVTAPEEVAWNQVFDVRIAPQEWSMPDPGASLLVSLDPSIEDLQLMFTLPVNAEVEGLEVVADSGHGWTGDATVSVDETHHRPGRIVLSVEEVPHDPGPGSGLTTYQLPAVEVTLRAIGPSGSAITPRVAGADEITAGFVFGMVTPFATADVRCWPEGGGSAPAMSETTIVAGPESVPTTLDLVAEPDAVEPGDDVVLSAVVSAPLGTVQFGLGEAILGEVEVSPNGLAEITVAVTATGPMQLEYSASYSGADGYEPSSGSVTVEVLEQVPAFSDVPVDHPFFEEIQWADENGIAEGYDDDLFHPTNPVTRQAAAAFLYRFAGDPYGPDPYCIASPFADVPTDHPFCGEITWMVDAGLTTGYGDGLDFQPNSPVTRQAMAAFLYRYSGGPTHIDFPCEASPFLDVPLDHPFCTEIAWMYDIGLAEGYDDGMFQPESVVTRQAAVAFLFRLSEIDH